MIIKILYKINSITRKFDGPSILFPVKRVQQVERLITLSVDFTALFVNEKYIVFGLGTYILTYVLSLP